MVFEKRICKTIEELKTYLEDKGFDFNLVEDHDEEDYGCYRMRWGPAHYLPNTSPRQPTKCYWRFNMDEKRVNFIGSNGKNAFPPEDGLRPADFEFEINGITIEHYCGVIFMELADNGCALYMSPIAKNFSINELDFCCKPGYITEDSPDIDENYTYTSTYADLQNGLILCTAPEEDGYWRYSWRYKDSREHKWVIDDTVSNITWGKEIPYVRLIPADLCVTLTKTLLNSGHWSNYIYTQVLGNAYPPNTIFKVGGQKFMSFTDNPPANIKEYSQSKTYKVNDLCYQMINADKIVYRCIKNTSGEWNNSSWVRDGDNNIVYRCPAYRLPPEASGINPSSATDEYSSLNTYKVGDFCIYGNTLYRCVTAVTVPEPFDYDKWVITTVSAEIARL